MYHLGCICLLPFAFAPSLRSNKDGLFVSGCNSLVDRGLLFQENAYKRSVLVDRCFSAIVFDVSILEIMMPLFLSFFLVLCIPTVHPSFPVWKTEMVKTMEIYKLDLAGGRALRLLHNPHLLIRPPGLAWSFIRS